MYWISCREQPKRGDSAAWELSWGGGGVQRNLTVKQLGKYCIQVRRITALDGRDWSVSRFGRLNPADTGAFACNEEEVWASGPDWMLWRRNTFHRWQDSNSDPWNVKLTALSLYVPDSSNCDWHTAPRAWKRTLELTTIPLLRKLSNSVDKVLILKPLVP